MIEILRCLSDRHTLELFDGKLILEMTNPSSHFTYTTVNHDNFPLQLMYTDTSHNPLQRGT